MTLILGLTGGIASGKSTVSRYFYEKGFPVIDADIIARKVVEPNTPGLANIVKVFGAEILSTDGTLDRKKLGNIVFNQPSKREQLDALLDKDIRQEINNQIRLALQMDVELVVVDIPLLFEGGYQKMVDEVMVVTLSHELQVRRLMDRNNLSQVEAEARINSQMPLVKKEKLADVVIDNSGDVTETYQQIDQWCKINQI